MPSFVFDGDEVELDEELADAAVLVEPITSG